MSSRSSTTPFRTVARSIRRHRPSVQFTCRNSGCAARQPLTTSSSPSQESQYNESNPRWQSTPTAMRAPFRHRLTKQEFAVNEDPQELDTAYDRLLGPGGRKMLNEETKWLAVTHKSFDHGSRGCCDRLAYLGRRILLLQADLALMERSAKNLSAPQSNGSGVDSPMQSSPLEKLQGLSPRAHHDALSKDRLADLGRRTRLLGVIRWKPRNPRNLEESGAKLALAMTIYAIIGAISLERGGEVATQIAKSRILQPLGLL